MRIGGLFFGYGGLDLAVSAVTGGELAWVSEIDKGANKIIAHRYPDVPNIGDITAVDWSQVEPVDIITGGSPCQDLSHAGKRGGMTEGTRSNLWVAMREAIAQLRPSLVVWENVRGAYSAEADSDLEFCPGCMGVPGYARPALRALGRVLGDLSSLGYDTCWSGLRAATIGAPHGRFRVFLVGTLGDSGWTGRETLWGGSDGTRPQPFGASGDLMLPSAVTLLPTPAVNDMGEGKTVEAWDDWTDAMQAKHGNGNGHGKSLSIEAQRLLPTPAAGMPNDGEPVDSWQARNDGLTQPFAMPLGVVVKQLDGLAQWGDYADAIARWEHLTRPAPSPTQLSSKGTPQLSPRFGEWMMGLPDGWVTDVPGITRNEALKAIGNGVVPQQAEAAIRFLLNVQAVAA